MRSRVEETLNRGKEREIPKIARKKVEVGVGGKKEEWKGKGRVGPYREVRAYYGDYLTLVYFWYIFDFSV